MQLLARGRLGLHHRINRFSHVVLFGDYEKKSIILESSRANKRQGMETETLAIS